MLIRFFYSKMLLVKCVKGDKNIGINIENNCAFLYNDNSGD